MKKAFLSMLLLLCVEYSFAQSVTLQQKLYYTCKIWGFVKYYHSNVSLCNVNWDSVLVSDLPAIISAPDDSTFNDELDTMLAAAGAMALSTSYFPDTLPANLKYNRNFGWFTASVLRSDVQAILDTIHNNFRPHTGCYVGVNPSLAPAFGDDGGYLIFPHDSVLLNVNTITSYPDEAHRLLLLFKFWNIINYFNPYNYVLDHPIDSVLSGIVMQVDSASTPLSLYTCIKKMTAQLNDEHVEELTYSNPLTYSGEYVPQLMLRYIEGKYVVVKSGITAIPIGDYITEVNGLPVSYWDDSLAKYNSAGNASVFHRDMCQYGLLSNVLGSDQDSIIRITCLDTLGDIDSITTVCSILWNDPSFFPNTYYPADSLSSISWTKTQCGAGYINSELINNISADRAFDSLYNAPAIIIDIRNNDANVSGLFELLADMYNGATCIDLSTLPDITYPGTYYNSYDSFYNSAPRTYNGTIIILVNEQTQSHLESYSILFKTFPKTLVVGSQTAGADGDVSYFLLTQDIHSGIATTGFFYPNGDSVQRIGVRVDTVVTPTISGIMQGRDEVLEKALQIACNIAESTPQVQIDNSLKVYPDPATVTLTISAGYFINTVTITNTLGQQVYNLSNADKQIDIDLSQLTPGIYFATINNSTVRKFVKQ